jgi:hypothetical protein
MDHGRGDCFPQVWRLRSVNMMVVCTLVSILLWRSSGWIGRMKQGEDLSLAHCMPWTTFTVYAAQSRQQQVTFAFEAEHVCLDGCKTCQHRIPQSTRPRPSGQIRGCGVCVCISDPHPFEASFLSCRKGPLYPVEAYQPLLGCEKENVY